MRITLLALVLVSAFAISQANAGSFPTQTPAPGELPAAPTDLLFLSGIFVSWSDNSDNEDGFRLTYRVGGGDEAAEVAHVYEIPADTEEFTLPDDAPRLCSAGYYFMDAELIAYNDAGESDADRYGIIVECDGALPTAAVPTPPVMGSPGLPAVGRDDGDGGSGLPIALVILVAGASLVATGVWRFGHRAAESPLYGATTEH